MDILLLAIGIGLFIVFLLFILIHHWQRVLTRYAVTLRRLTDRLEALEEIATPQLLQEIENRKLSSLEQVYTFTLRFDDYFWRHILKATPTEMTFVREHGAFLGSVNIERWRTHAAVNVSELLPQTKSASWQKRSFEIYADILADDFSGYRLWSLSLGASHLASTPARLTGVELRLERNALALYALQGAAVAMRNGDSQRLDNCDLLLISVPLEPAMLDSYRVAEQFRADAFEAVREGGSSLRVDADSQLSVFEHHNGMGIDWRLCVRDVAAKKEPIETKIIEGSKFEQTV